MHADEEHVEPSALAPFLADWMELGREGFVERHGRAMLFLLSDLVERADQGATAFTPWVDGAPAQAPEPAADEHADEVFVVPVHPLVDGHDALSIGAGDANDIVLRDQSVGDRHAWMGTDADGAFVLQDRRTKNGTHVDGMLAGIDGIGPPTTLRSRHTLRFGSVQTRFLADDELFAYLEWEGQRRANGEPPRVPPG
jgi:hypothetical protein